MLESTGGRSRSRVGADELWEIDDVVKWAKLACRRAVDCEALSLQNRDGWYQLKLQRDKERAAAERLGTGGLGIVN